MKLATPLWLTGLTWLLAAVFFATALGKALDVAGFARILGTYELFPDMLLIPLAPGIIALEFLIAVGLMREETRRLAAMGAMWLAAGNGLLLSFTLWRGIAWQNCGCFGVFLARPLTLLSPLEDVVLLLMAWFVWRASRP